MINFDLVYDINSLETEAEPPKIVEAYAFTDCEEDGTAIDKIDEPENIDAAIGWLTIQIDKYTGIREFLLSKAD